MESCKTGVFFFFANTIPLWIQASTMQRLRFSIRESEAHQMFRDDFTLGSRRADVGFQEFNELGLIGAVNIGLRHDDSSPW